MNKALTPSSNHLLVSTSSANQRHLLVLIELVPFISFRTWWKLGGLLCLHLKTPPIDIITTGPWKRQKTERGFSFQNEV